MKTIATNGLAAFNQDIDLRGEKIVDLIKTYIPGFVTRDYGYKNFGRTSIAYPAIFVDPMKIDYKMVATGKTLLTVAYFMQWFVVDNNSTDVLSQCESGGDALKKLFSNNALGDISTTHTAKFKANPGYWIDSEMSGIEISRALKNAAAQNINNYMRVGQMRLTVTDYLIA